MPDFWRHSACRDDFRAVMWGIIGGTVAIGVLLAWII